MLFSSEERNVPRSILSQFRWMEKIVDSKHMSDKLIEILGVCPNELKKEIIAFIPEILDDNDHEVKKSSSQFFLFNFFFSKLSKNFKPLWTRIHPLPFIF